MNEIQLSNDLNVITAEINSYKQVAGQAIFEIGMRLKHVKENDLAHGEFGKWLETIEMDKYQASRFIKVATELGDSKLRSGANIGFKALYEIATMPPEEREKEHTLSSGETKTVDEMTVRELQEVKRNNKRLIEEKEQLEKRLKESQDRKPKIIEKLVEVDNTDYETINRLNKQVEDMQNRLQRLNNDKQNLQDRVELMEDENEEYHELQRKIERLNQQKDDLHRQIESATSLSALYADIEYMLQNKLAPVKYSKALTERKDSKVAMNNLKNIIEVVEEWVNEMKMYLPNENIINAEVIENE